MAHINIPTPALSYPELKAILINELVKQEQGYLCTIRGLARLLAVSVSTLVDGRLRADGLSRGVLKRITTCSPDQLPDSLKPIAGFDYTLARTANTGTSLLSEVVISAIVKYYAYDNGKPNQRAQQLDHMFSSVGVRSVFDQIASQESLVEATADNKEVTLEPEPDVIFPVAKETQIDKALLLIHKLESYRLRREEVISFLDNLGLLASQTARNTNYRGVVKDGNRWGAQIAVHGVTRSLGSYVSMEEAARAYDNYAKVIHGNKARLNFPQS